VKRAAVALCLFIVLLAPVMLLSQSGLVLANAEAAIPKPSVPEFTLKFVAHPYDVPSKYEINPYTGQNEMTEAGYHVENKSIEITIRNQPFTSTLDENGNYANLYYAVRFKGHYADKWNYYPHDMDSNYSTAIATPFNASESEYTTITVGLETYLLNNFPAGGQVDFQVEAFIGYEKRVDFFFLGEGHYYAFTAFERSGWSETQTITIPPSGSSSSSSSISPKSTPDQTTEPTPKETQQTLQLDLKIEFFPTVPVEVAAIATVIVIVVVCAGLLLCFKKRKQETGQV